MPIDDLVELIKAGDEAGVREAIEGTPELLGVEASKGGFPAHWCALHGHLKLLRFVREKGGKLDARTKNGGMQPLHWAVMSDQLDAVRYLVNETGASTNEPTAAKSTPLMLAAQNGHDSLVYWLLKQGADLSMLDNCGDSAMHWAAYKNQVGALALIATERHVDAMSIASAQDTFGSTALHLAAGQGALAAVRWLLKQPEAERMRTQADHKGHTPAALAAAKGKGDAEAVLKGTEDWGSWSIGVGDDLGHKISAWATSWSYVEEDKVVVVPAPAAAAPPQDAPLKASAE